MTIDATPLSDAPTHHLSLAAGGTTIGFILCDGRALANPRAMIRTPIQRTSLKTSQGSTRYSDFSEPFTPIAQDDWSGGRAHEDFDRDQSRFYDSYRLNTWMGGQLILGPQEQYTTGYRVDDYVMPGSVTWTSLLTTTRYLARSFSAQGGAMDRVTLWVRRIGTPGNLIVELNNNSAGDPGTARQTVTVTPATFGSDVASVLYSFDWSGTDTLTGATTYWIKIYAASADSAASHWEVGTSSTVGTTEASSDNSTWAAASVGLYFRLLDADDDRESLFFTYKQGLYMVSKPTDGSAAQVWINGDRGTADANTGALTTTVDATKAWTVDEYIGSIVIITAGTGIEEIQPWRVITSNSATALTHAAWNITHDTTTEYVIVADDKWIEITGHGLTVPVTDVLVSKDVVYFAQGTTTMRRMQGTTAAGVWTVTWAADGTNTGKFFELVEDPVDGQQVWRAITTPTATTVSRANAQSWGTDLTFGTAITVGSFDDKITGLERYGSPEVLWALKEASVWAVQNDIPDQIPLREIGSVQSDKNGRGHLVHGVYLYFSLLHSLERYFRNNLDDIGPSRELGLPSNRQGPIVELQGYPGVFFAAIDGGASNYSSILVYNQLGWHELYRAPQVGQRIRNLYFQVIPGTTVDRLWFSQGTDVLWLPFPSDTLNPVQDSGYLFTHEGGLVSSWFYANLQDVLKLYKSAKVFAETLTASAQTVDIYYQTDGASDSSTWNAITGTFDTVPVEEIDLTAANSVTARRLRYRLIVRTNDAAISPKIKAVVLETLARITTKFQYACTYRAQDEDIGLEGDDVTEYTRVETLLTQLDTWANSPTVLTMRSVYSPFDSKNVLLDPSSLQPFTLIADDQTEVHIGQLSLTEI